MYNAEEYTISVRKERMDEEIYWVARVEELPDVMEFGETRDEAYELAIDTITTGQEMCLAEGTLFPAPKIFTDANASGRVTLRLPKSVHASCIIKAENEGVSLNSYILTCIAAYRPQQEMSIRSSIFDELKKGILSLASPPRNVELVGLAEYAYSRKGQFRVVLDNTDSEDFGHRSKSAQSAFREINLQGWDVVTPC